MNSSKILNLKRFRPLYGVPNFYEAFPDRYIQACKVFVPSTGFLISTYKRWTPIQKGNGFRPLYGVPNFYESWWCKRWGRYSFRPLYGVPNFYNSKLFLSWVVVGFRPLYGVPNFYKECTKRTQILYTFSSPLRGS